MPGLQQIIHNGKLAALIIAGQAIIDDTLADEQRRQVQAMCLYALEIQDGQRPGPYSDSDALGYAEQAAKTTQR
jgi:hypothetical protein